MKLVLLVPFFWITSLQGSWLPAWFTQSFNDKKLNERYAIIKPVKPNFLEADFTGDKINDIAVQVIDKKNRKRGVLIINGGTNKHYIFGAGYKFASEDFDDTNWVDGWSLYKSKVAYKTLFDADGDISGSKKVKIAHVAVSIYAIEDGSELAGALIYWNGTKYVSIHQGE
ncbi:hypothetical protein [Mucilaginibacter aquariorum]|uniref:VCBS repeat-containing protein n=1 Tax=Mucilaginibacter aquariorum TaxID=2967225 RepID=A0ABT1T5W2_9SPHI|nr:hypothetical protein [Mucilaginibacter aquariorum]MCQ6959780.1 hypothetical protein [Mucilaginibacter aquariorum]